MYVAVLNSSRVVLGVLQGMQAIDSLMATLLVTCWLTLSAVLMLNLLIALLSNTFQRYVPVPTKTSRRYAFVLINTFQRFVSVPGGRILNHAATLW